MKPIKLQIVSDQGVEATIVSDGSQGGANDYYAVVSVTGFIENKKIYGIDPIQSFSLGMKLIETLTEKKRIGEEDVPMNGTSWKIEVISD